ncbi:MAG: phosphatidylserine decarboxylase family protein [Desulfovibrionaceae bacterium]
MRNSSVSLAREGVPFIFLAAFATLVFALLEWEIAACAALALTVFSVNFFRDPERVIPSTTHDPLVAVSPADGKVVKIGRMRDPITGEERTAVCVFMNVFNVHVNRCAVAGTVERIRYYPGKFLNASFDKASEDNERCALGIVDAHGGRWTMVQIAGLIARRIVCWAEEGDVLGRGQRYGLIRFGSRVDLYLPQDYTPAVGIGDKVLAGQTILASKRTAGE